MKTHSFLGGSGCHANMISATLIIQYNTLLLWLDCVNSPLKCRSRLLYWRLPCVLVHIDSAVPPRIGRGVNSPIQREGRPPQMWQYLPTLKNAPTQRSTSWLHCVHTGLCTIVCTLWCAHWGVHSTALVRSQTNFNLSAIKCYMCHILVRLFLGGQWSDNCSAELSASVLLLMGLNNYTLCGSFTQVKFVQH